MGNLIWRESVSVFIMPRFADKGSSKGSYYAHPTLDERQGDEQKYPEYFSPNVWPSEEDCPGYREAFMKLASFVQDVGVKLARAMDEVSECFL